MFAPKCGGCARAILENYISALNSLWHPECFVCRVSNHTVCNESVLSVSKRHYHNSIFSLLPWCCRSASRHSLTAASSIMTGSHTARPTITSAVALCAPAARSPSPAAASQPWAGSSIRSTLCVLSASSSWTRAPSRSRTTSLTAKAASLNSSAKVFVYECVRTYVYMFLYMSECTCTHMYSMLKSVKCFLRLRALMRWWVTSLRVRNVWLLMTFDTEGTSLAVQPLRLGISHCCLRQF